jgi:zinc/manganese transport system ATP-binding protein
LSAAVLSVADLTVETANALLFRRLTFDLAAGELLVVLGPNGAGKTTLVRALLGLVRAATGTVRIEGAAPSRLRSRLGYVPQHRGFDPDTPLRARDFVQLGQDGHRYGFGRQGRASVDDALAEVGALEQRDLPVGRLSGGEQQRLRIAQALVCDPKLLLVDEPLQSLDIGQQEAVVSLLERRRASAGTPVVFVTHDVNPVLRRLDRVLYIAQGKWAVGDVAEVMTSETLSRLYAADVDVLNVRGRLIVVGTDVGGHH